MSSLSRNHVKVFGRGWRPTVFAHGFGCHQQMWRWLTPAFDDDCRPVLFEHLGAVDHRGGRPGLSRTAGNPAHAVSAPRRGSSNDPARALRAGAMRWPVHLAGRHRDPRQPDLPGPDRTGPRGPAGPVPDAAPDDRARLAGLRNPCPAAAVPAGAGQGDRLQPATAERLFGQVASSALGRPSSALIVPDDPAASATAAPPPRGHAQAQWLPDRPTHSRSALGGRAEPWSPRPAGDTSRTASAPARRCRSPHRQAGGPDGAQRSAGQDGLQGPAGALSPRLVESTAPIKGPAGGPCSSDQPAPADGNFIGYW